MEWLDDHQILAKFEINDRMYVFRIRISSVKLLTFSSIKATIRFEYVDELSAKYSFNGNVAPDEINSRIENGPIINGVFREFYTKKH
jgi:hypothetical protein